jgi:ribonuclease D
MKPGKYLENIDEAYLKTLPIKSFDGDMFLIDTEEKSVQAMSLLKDANLLGFDTETRPSFRKGRIHPVALLQLATHDKAFLFRLNKIRLPGFLIRILEDPSCLKIGVALKDDIRSLIRLRRFEPAGFVELQEYVKQYGIADNGLKKLTANVLGFRISKRNQTSNWEQDVLTGDQLRYAATDAWTCLEIYRKLNHHSST